MLITSPQLAALYAMRQTAPVLDVDEDLNAHRLIVTSPNGQKWLIDQAGTTYTITTQENAA